MELNLEHSNGERLWAQCQAVADMKFTYVVSCQQYGIHKRSGDSRAQDILRLMTTYLSKLDNMNFSYSLLSTGDYISVWQISITSCCIHR